MQKIKKEEEKGNRTEGDIKEKYINSIEKKTEEHVEGTKEKENNEAKEKKKMKKMKQKMKQITKVRMIELICMKVNN